MKSFQDSLPTVFSHRKDRPDASLAFDWFNKENDRKKADRFIRDYTRSQKLSGYFLYLLYNFSVTTYFSCRPC